MVQQEPQEGASETGEKKSRGEPRVFAGCRRLSGRYWARTSDLRDVNATLYPTELNAPCRRPERTRGDFRIIQHVGRECLLAGRSARDSHLGCRLGAIPILPQLTARPKFSCPKSQLIYTLRTERPADYLRWSFVSTPIRADDPLHWMQ